MTHLTLFVLCREVCWHLALCSRPPAQAIRQARYAHIHWIYAATDRADMRSLRYVEAAIPHQSDYQSAAPGGHTVCAAPPAFAAGLRPDCVSACSTAIHSLPAWMIRSRLQQFQTPSRCRAGQGSLQRPLSLSLVQRQAYHGGNPHA